MMVKSVANSFTTSMFVEKWIVTGANLTSHLRHRPLMGPRSPLDFNNNEMLPGSRSRRDWGASGACIHPRPQSVGEELLSQPIECLEEPVIVKLCIRLVGNGLRAMTQDMIVILLVRPVTNDGGCRGTEHLE